MNPCETIRCGTGTRCVVKDGIPFCQPGMRCLFNDAEEFSCHVHGSCTIINDFGPLRIIRSALGNRFKMVFGTNWVNSDPFFELST